MFHNGTGAFFRQFPGPVDVSEMLGYCGSLDLKNLGHLFLRQPDRFSPRRGGDGHRPVPGGEQDQISPEIPEVPGPASAVFPKSRTMGTPPRRLLPAAGSIIPFPGIPHQGDP